MDMKAILRKSFVRYGIIGICNPSWRGCHEPTVPTALIKNFAFRSVSAKKNKINKHMPEYAAEIVTNALYHPVWKKAETAQSGKEVKVIYTFTP